MKKVQTAEFAPENFSWSADGKVGTITQDRPDRKNPLTFDSCGELRDFFNDLSSKGD